MFALHIRARHLPIPAREYQFDQHRKWRADFAFLSPKILVEIEGGVGGKSRHTSAKGFDDDSRKYSAAAIAGWMVLRFSTRMVKSGEAITTLEKALMCYPR